MISSSERKEEGCPGERVNETLLSDVHLWQERRGLLLPKPWEHRYLQTLVSSWECPGESEMLQGPCSLGHPGVEFHPTSPGEPRQASPGGGGCLPDQQDCQPDGLD